MVLSQVTMAAGASYWLPKPLPEGVWASRVEPDQPEMSLNAQVAAKKVLTHPFLSRHYALVSLYLFGNTHLWGRHSRSNSNQTLSLTMRTFSELHVL